MTDNKELKRNAKAYIRSHRRAVLLAALLFLLVSLLVSVLRNRINNGGVSMWELEQQAEKIAVQYDPLEDPTGYFSAVTKMVAETRGQVKGMAQLLVVALEVVGVVWSAGLSIFALRLVRSGKAELGSMLEGFGLIWKLYFLNFLTTALVSFATLLLIVPGVIASYGLRQSVYLLLEHPEWPTWRCMGESWRMMRGHKWQNFMLDLSFIGWGMLCIFPPVLLYVIPYMELSQVGFYTALTDGAGGVGNYAEGEKPPWEY